MPETDGVVVEIAPEAAVAPSTRSRRTRSAPATRTIALTRAQEMAYIRADMQRLFIVGGSLLALMFLLLLFTSR